MRNRNVFLMCFITLSMSMAEAANYKFDGIWTGENPQSGAPVPSCPCADPSYKGFNIIECKSPNFDWTAADFNLNPDSTEFPKVCYDEYIPQGSGGWAHALMFRRVDDKANK